MAGRAPHLTRCSALFAAAHDPAVDGMAAVGKECGDTDERKVRPASQRRNRSGSAKPTKSSPVSECEQGGQRPRHAADFASCGRIEQHRFLSPPTEEPGMPQQRGSAGARLPIEERGGRFGGEGTRRRDGVQTARTYREKTGDPGCSKEIGEIFISLTAPQILRLGKKASELAFFSRLIRIFDIVLDTPPQQNRKQVCFCFRLIRIFGSALDTLAPRNASGAVVAPADSYPPLRRGYHRRSMRMEFASAIGSGASAVELG